ncbi:MAG: hypothetical protein HQ500_08405 [Flavobacteriales bacterium]|nr:hypothetical protein [Flavobacteriales bacterium]
MITMVACQKDAAIDEGGLAAETLINQVADHQAERIQYTAFGFVGNHPSFERVTDGFPIHAYAVIPEGASEVRYFETDSLQFRDSLRAYRRQHVRFERLGDGLLVRALRENIRRDRFVRMTYRLDDSLFITPAITLRAASLNSAKMDDIESGWNSEGYYAFNWRSVPGSDRYFIVLRDRSGDALIALTTERTSFQWYDLRSVALNFFPALRDPQLVEGNPYTMSIYAITQRGWLTATGDHAFTLQSE